MADLVDFERRADLAEKEIEELSKRLTDLESGSSNKGANAKLQAVLVKLRELRRDFANEQEAAAQVKKERDEAVAELTQLREENRKLKFRVKHLVGGLDKFMGPAENFKPSTA